MAKVNNTFNKVMDRYGVSANVKSLGGKFIVRQGTDAKTESDWDWVGDENVGSQVRPILRRESQVPMFISQGDIIKVDTRSGTYIERAG